VFLAFWLMPGGAIACETVVASWYGKETCNGRPPGRGKYDCQTADGTPFDGSQFLVAHKKWPLGSKVRITYRGKSVVAPVLDRGPYIAGRSIDLSRAVAKALGFDGVHKVCVERV
jgi:rare lipoprotein A